MSPVGSAEAERSFSVLRYIKMHMRATMIEETLDELRMMAIHYKEAKSLYTGDIVKRYVKAYPSCLFCNLILFSEIF